MVDMEKANSRETPEVDKKNKEHQESTYEKKNGGNKEKRDPLDSRSLAPWFATVILLFVLSSLWALWDEAFGRRPWKRFQSEFTEIAERKLEKDLAVLSTTLEQSQEYQEYKDKLYQARKAHDESPVRQKLANQISDIDTQLETLKKDLTSNRAQYQATVYKMEKSKDDDESGKILTDIKRVEVEIDKITEEMTNFNEQKRKLRETLKKLGSEIIFLENKTAEFEKPLRDINLRIEAIHSEKIGIRQRFNHELGLVDRCESCHLGASKKGLSDLTNPFQTHPDVLSLPYSDPEIEATRNILDIHPVEKYGCTTCHRGQGYATTTVEKAHGEVEYWLTPMLRRENVQASCLKCHSREPRLPSADLLNEGRRLFSDLGCVWCHKTPVINPEEKRGENVFDLTQVTLKTNIAWLVDWIEKPKRFRSDTLMPDAFLKRSEAIAIAAYLWQKSKTTETLAEAPPFRESDIKPGKTLFESRACLACHKVKDKGDTYAMNLSRIGEKTNYKYIANWVMDPRKWQPEGEMPKVVFNSEEVFRIAAYLSTLREKPLAETGIKFDDPDLIVKGKKLIVKYDCYRCHKIPGLEDVQSAAPDLPNLGSKPIGQFDFGLLEESILQAGGIDDSRENVSKARELWIQFKLKDPRGFDKGKYLKPEEGLRMPDFSLTPGQIDALTVFLLGITDERPPLSYQYMPTTLEKAIARGRIYFRHYRCFACHGEEGIGGVINPNYAKITVPALDTLAEKLHLDDLEDADIVMQLLVRGLDLSSIRVSPVPQFPIVKGQYKALLELIREGQLVKKKESSGPEPPFHMPSWKGTLKSGQINEIVIYLLSEYPWDEDEWDESEEDEEQG